MNTINMHNTTSNGVEVKPKIIIGLGNPEDAYGETYHNVGSKFVLYIKNKNKFPEWKDSKLFRSTTFNNITLVLPKKFMNESGMSMTAVLQEFRVRPEEILVAHDDHDIPLGSYKLSFGQGSAGHKGVQSIIDAIGNEFSRFRIGISKIPGGTPHTKAEDVVLTKITNEDKEIFYEVFEKILEENFISLSSIELEK